MDPSPSPHLDLPQILGCFRLLRPIGSGGMSVVYLGERIEQFTQQVAIKVLYPQLFPNAGESSVDRESRLLAAFDHPGIVRMLDVGVTSTNVRYIVMEYVDGLPLDQYCDYHRLPIRKRVEILLDVLEAVEHAHRRLVIHADLKPDNILVTEEGKPRLLDFGVSAVVSELGAHREAIEQFTDIFASPEQRSGESLAITSDIYSLGIIAQELLTGVRRRALSVASHPGATTNPIPLTASRSFAHLTLDLQVRLAGCRGTLPDGVKSDLRGDIDAILLKATEVDPAQRFQSAQEMRDELKRHLAGYPIQTGPTRWLTHVKKWMLRNPLIASSGLVFLLALVISVTGVVVQVRTAARKRQVAQTRLLELVRLTDVLAGELYDSTRELKGSDAPRAELLSSAHETIAKLAAETDHDPQLELELARGYEKLARLELGQIPLARTSLKQASEDLQHAMKLLANRPQSDPEVNRVLQSIRETDRLQGSATAGNLP